MPTSAPVAATATAAGEVGYHLVSAVCLCVLILLAIAFTYFEALLRVGDVTKFEDEEARLNSLSNLLDHLGYSRDIWSDFAESALRATPQDGQFTAQHRRCCGRSSASVLQRHE